MGYGRSAEKEKKSINSSFRPNMATRNRPPNYVPTNAVEVEKTLAKSSHPSRRVGKGTNPCWVCGSDKHLWYNCDKKKKGTCACCGSMAHITRDCAQRYFPANYSAAGMGQNSSKEQRRGSQNLKKPKRQEESSVDSPQEVIEKSSKRNVRSTRKSKQKTSALCSSSSEEDSSSDSSSNHGRTHRRSACLVQRGDNCEGDHNISVQCLSSVLDRSTTSVASKAVLDWPNVWDELSVQYPIGSMLQLAPISSPPRSSLLYYQVEVNRMPAVAMFDTGASQSFITYDLADQLQASLTPLKESLITVDFGGQKSSIEHTVQLSLRLTSISRMWTFYVSKNTPAPIVLGLDLVLEWPMFLNPRDRCLYIPLSSSPKKTLKLSSAVSACLPVHTPLDVSAEVEVEASVSFQESFDSVKNNEDDFCTELSYNPETYAVEYIRQCSVTASGFAEAEELAKFIDSLPSDFRAVVNKFPQLFQPPDRDPPSRSVKHYICVPSDVVPAARKAYPLPQYKLMAIREQIRELIDKGWVEPSASPWASPILFIPKDDGTKQRMCIDFRDLNALTKKDRFPLPRIDLLLHRSAKACIFSKIDLASGFHQIEVFPQHRELTAFILPETIDGQSLWE